MKNIMLESVKSQMEFQWVIQFQERLGVYII